MLFPAIFPWSVRFPRGAPLDLSDETPTGRAEVRTADGTLLWAPGAVAADDPHPAPRRPGHGDATGED